MSEELKVLQLVDAEALKRENEELRRRVELLEADCVYLGPTLGRAEAAQYLGIGKSTLSLLVSKGEIRSYHYCGKSQYLKKDLDEFLLRKTVPERRGLRVAS